MKKTIRPTSLLLLFMLLALSPVFSQVCTTAGQTPSTAFPVCGTTAFQQNTVPICSTNDLFVPGCSGSGNALYQNKNPFFYKFTCYVSGTLGFLITPNASNEDYDWQLFDITGRDPNEIFTNNSLVVTANWAGTYGPTGASASGVNFIQCASDPADNKPTFAVMPNLIAGHEYLLLVSHFSNTQSGYSLSFNGGTAVITDPAIPHLKSAKADCDGKKIIVKLNKNVRCNSLTATGTEFSLLPAVTTVVAASTSTCSPGFDLNEITLTLAAPLGNGNFQLVINNGSDGNTLKDFCDNLIPAGEQISFQYLAPQPIFADSLSRVGCAPDSIRIYFPKKINCNSIAANGSDFSVTGPAPVTVASAFGNCINGKTDYIVIKFAAPIYTGGTYQLTLKTGTDGTTVIDECGQESPLQTLPFQASDTVDATFQYSTLLGCEKNTLTFSHDGAHNVNQWKWRFNNSASVTTQTHTISFPSTSTNSIYLWVSNGVCSDSTSQVIVFNNEVKADFSMLDIICPEDKLEVTNNSTGQIDSWRWNFDVLSSSTLKDPLPVLFPLSNREAYYTVKLLAYNNTLGCTDSISKTVTVLDHCFIAVPTAFTPNNDGLNDYFWPHNAIKAENYDFKVFNRWGQLIFHSRNWKEKWDGKINGVLQGTGVFVWMLSYTHKDTHKQVFQKGTVTLIR
ncbi:MAG TPA: gliding motility-associated C-terminal domain-containing protein [Chitinophagaceae bacterium]